MSEEVQQPESLEIKYDLIELRKAKVLQFAATGLNQSEIAESLGVDKSTISRDIQQMKRDAKKDMRKYIEQTLPFEHKKTIAAFDEIIKQAWFTASHNKSDPKVMLQALAIISDSVMKRQQVLGDPQYIQQAIRTVARLRKQVDEKEEIEVE